MSAAAQLIIAGRIATLAGDSGFGWQEALAIGNGAVLAAGPLADVQSFAGPGTRIVRLADAECVLPGITDAHLHLMVLTLGETQLDLTGSGLDTALSAVGERHRAMAAAGDEAGWLLGHGWSLDLLGAWPDADQLEQVAPGRPIALYAHDHHSRWVSQAAIARASLEAAGDPAGGMIRRSPDGRATGMLHETAAALVNEAIPAPSGEQVEAGLQRVAARLAALGVTGCHDPGELGSDTTMARGPLFYAELAARDRLPLRVHASIRSPQLETAISAGLVSGQGSGRYRMGWLKLFVDGSLGARSAALLAPYEDAATRPPTGSPRGLFVTEPEELLGLISRAAEAGIAAEVHAIGDAAVRAALDAFAGAPRARVEPVRRIEHAQLVDPADVPRFGALDVAASVQPVHLRTDAAPARVAWGRRSELAFPLRGLADGGALLPFGTDAPVEPPDPWPGIAISVTRRSATWPDARPVGRAHALPLDRAVRAACLDPALVAGRNDLGRLLPGYRADLVVVPGRPFVHGDGLGEIESLRPSATLLDGELVFGSLE